MISSVPTHFQEQVNHLIQWFQTLFTLIRLWFWEQPFLFVIFLCIATPNPKPFNAIVLRWQIPAQAWVTVINLHPLFGVVHMALGYLVQKQPLYVSHSGCITFSLCNGTFRINPDYLLSWKRLVAGKQETCYCYLQLASFLPPTVVFTKNWKQWKFCLCTSQPSDLLMDDVCPKKGPIWAAHLTKIFYKNTFLLLKHISQFCYLLSHRRG